MANSITTNSGSTFQVNGAVGESNGGNMTMIGKNVMLAGFQGTVAGASNAGGGAGGNLTPTYLSMH